MIYKLNEYTLEFDINNVLLELRSLYGKPKEFKLSGDSIAVTCPIHADGHENHPSAYLNLNNSNVPKLFYHCFTCGHAGPFEYFVSQCINGDGAQWLINRYSISKQDTSSMWDDVPILNETSETKVKPKYLPEEYLDKFESWHPYMAKRKLTREVVNRFKIKYDPDTRSIIFPTRDIKGNLVGVTRRSVDGKKFLNDKNMNKDNIFLLYEAKKYRYCVVVESQINCLTCWCNGIPAIALYGAGTTYSQVNILKNTEISVFYLLYDPDEAGEHGRERFKKFIGNSKIVDDINLPEGKDVNDLTREEFDKYVREKIGEAL